MYKYWTFFLMKLYRKWSKLKFTPQTLPEEQLQLPRDGSVPDRIIAGSRALPDLRWTCGNKFLCYFNNGNFSYFCFCCKPQPLLSCVNIYQRWLLQSDFKWCGFVLYVTFIKFKSVPVFHETMEISMEACE